MAYTGPTSSHTTIFDVEMTVGPYEGGWSAQFDYPATDGPCSLTLLGTGMTEDEFLQIVDLAGLSAGPWPDGRSPAD